MTKHDVDVIDTTEYRHGVADGIEAAARYMERRAEQFEKETTHLIGTTMAMIFREEATKIRNSNTKSADPNE